MSDAFASGAVIVERLRALGHRARLIAPGLPMPTVRAAAAAIGVDPLQIVKSVLFVASDGTGVLAVVAGERRIDAQALQTAAGSARLRLADAPTVLRMTGYPAGGVAPVFFVAPLRVVVDDDVLALHTVYAGGGTHDTLIELDPRSIVAVNGATSARILGANVVAPAP